MTMNCDTFLLLIPVDRLEDEHSGSLVATESRKDWDLVFLDRAGNMVSVDLPEAVRNRRIRNLAHRYWCGMVMEN